MTRNQDRDRVRAERVADGARRAGMPDAAGQLRVRRRLAIGDTGGVREHARLELAGIPEIERHREIRAYPGEVFRQLGSRAHEMPSRGGRRRAVVAGAVADAAKTAIGRLEVKSRDVGGDVVVGCAVSRDPRAEAGWRERGGVEELSEQIVESIHDVLVRAPRA